MALQECLIIFGRDEGQVDQASPCKYEKFRCLSFVVISPSFVLGLFLYESRFPYTWKYLNILQECESV